MPNSIAIIGAGYAGVSVAANLARMHRQPLTIYLIEKREQFAQGAAYSTHDEVHLLNVAARGMSAWHDVEDDFVRWLEKNKSAHENWADRYVPRKWYAEYCRDLLQQAAGQPGVTLHKINDEALALHAVENQFSINLKSGKEIIVDKVVLAHGNFPPKNLYPHLPEKNYLANPWFYREINQIKSEQTVFIVGTGLTMVDVILSLHKQKHQGKIYALSRRGQLPRAHVVIDKPYQILEKEIPNSSFGLFKFVRQHVKRAVQQGYVWQAVINALRPHTQKIWQKLSRRDKQQFLRHVVPYWDTHRHRIAPEVAEVVEKLRQNGQLKLLAGKIKTIKSENRQVEIIYLPRNEKNEKKILSDYVINCTGPSSDYRHAPYELVQQLMRVGMITTDALHLGIDVNDEGFVIDVAGKINKNLAAIGTPTKGHSWEIIAVPDIRTASYKLAQKMSYLSP